MNSIEFGESFVTPSKVVCVARNYLGHIKELGNAVPTEPIFFIKPNSAISQDLVLPAGELIDYEGEIVFLIRNAVISGVGFGLDLTKRGEQLALKKQGLPWERSKAFDRSTVLSRFVLFGGDGQDLSLCLSINGRVIQSGGVENMIHPPRALLAEAQTFLSFEDNDLLMTGTPSGVGTMTAGDVFLGQIFLKQDLVIAQEWIVVTA